jgi:hypothetical protein
VFVNPRFKVNDGCAPRFIVALHDDFAGTRAAPLEARFAIGGINVCLKRRREGIEVAVTGWDQSLPRMANVFRALTVATRGSRKLRETRYYQLVALQSLREVRDA